MIFKEKKDCEVSPLDLKDYCYTKSKALLQQIKLNKNFCVTNDECAISFENLKEPSATLNPKDKVDTVTVGNKEITIYCFDPEQDYSLVTHSLFNVDHDESSKTVKANTYTISLTFINASEEQKNNAIQEAQTQVDALAKNLATLTLSCTVSNELVRVNCYGDDNEINLGVVYPEVDNSITVSDSTIKLKVSVQELINFITNYNGISLDTEDYFESIKQINASIKRDFFLRYKNLANKSALINAYTGLNCVYGNVETDASCLDAEATLNSKTYDFTPLDVDGYSSSVSLSENSYTQSLSYSNAIANAIDSEVGDYSADAAWYNSEWETDNQEENNSDSYELLASPSDDYISGFKSAINASLSEEGDNSFNSQVVDVLKELATNYLDQNLNCYYGNPELDFDCSGSYTINNEDPTTFKSIHVPQVTNTVTLRNPVKVSENSVILRADYINSDSDKQAEANKAAADILQQTIEVANSTLQNCGYYNHIMYVYCDKGVAENDKLANGPDDGLESGETNEWGNTAYNGNLSRTWTAQYNYNIYNFGSDMHNGAPYLKILISYEKLSTSLSATSIDTLASILANADAHAYGNNGSNFSFENPLIIFFVYFNDYKNVKVELDANAAFQEGSSLDSTLNSSTCTSKISIPYTTDILDTDTYDQYISSAADCPLPDYDDSDEAKDSLGTSFIYRATSDIKGDNDALIVPEGSEVNCESHQEANNTIYCKVCSYTNPDIPDGEPIDLPTATTTIDGATITYCPDVTVVQTTMSDLNSGLRLASKDSSVLYCKVNYGTLNSLSYSSSITNQVKADLAALNYVLPQISCVYGNIPLRPLACLPCLCSAAGGLSSYAQRVCGTEIAMNSYFADTPEGADMIAMTIRRSTRQCQCKVRSAECTYEPIQFYTNTCGGWTGFKFTICADITQIEYKNAESDIPAT